MIWNLGSINIDNVYLVPHLPIPGETLAATRFMQGLGGKGANMSIAAARAAAHVSHIGAVGQDGRWAVQRLLEYGVDTPHIAQLGMVTGHANICIDASAQKTIVLSGGANLEVSQSLIGSALSEASPGDFLLMQNETNGQSYAAEIASKLGLRIAYAAAPFSFDAVLLLLDRIDLMILNESEAAELENCAGMLFHQLGIKDVIVTLGAEGCRWIRQGNEKAWHFPAIQVEPVDTTGAGDTFTGYLIAGLDRGLGMEAAIDMAQKAAALMVTRYGTGDVISDLKEVQDAFGL